MERLHELFVLNRALEEFIETGLLPSEYHSVMKAEEEGEDSQQEEQEESVCLFWLKRKKHIILDNVMPELLDYVVSRYFVEDNGVYSPKYKNFHIHSQYTSKDGTVYYTLVTVYTVFLASWITLLSGYAITTSFRDQCRREGPV